LIFNRLFYCKKLFPKRRIRIFRYKIKVMSWLTLFIVCLSVVALGYLVARFWLEIALIFIVIRTIFVLTTISGASTLIWVAFIESKTDGWQQTWIFFFILYSTILGIILVIIFDLYKYGVSFVRDIFKIK